MAAQSKYWIEFLFLSNLKDTNRMWVLVGSSCETGHEQEAFHSSIHTVHTALSLGSGSGLLPGDPYSSSCANALHSILFHLLPVFFMCLFQVYMQFNHSLAPLNLFFKLTLCQSLWLSLSQKLLHLFGTWGFCFVHKPSERKTVSDYTEAEVNLFFFSCTGITWLTIWIETSLPEQPCWAGTRLPSSPHWFAEDLTLTHVLSLKPTAPGTEDCQRTITKCHFN